jgi:hypothetical protein
MMPAMLRHVFSGTWRFTLVSLGGFSLWAFGGRWFYRHLGEAGFYGITALVFVGLALLLLPALVKDAGGRTRLARAFVPAFLAYAFGWCLMWFMVGGRAGEWLGALLGCFAFVLILGKGFGAQNFHVISWLVFFTLHTGGYFTGGWLMDWTLQARPAGSAANLNNEVLGAVAKLAWGLAYGIGFGAGLGYVIHTLCLTRPSRTEPHTDADSNTTRRV